MIDLHVHTTYSDGEYTPLEVVEIAKKSNLDTISITDHDTCLGVEEAIKRGNEIGVKIIPGIEITAYEDEEIHILGYNIDYKSEKLNVYYEELKEKLKIEENRIFETFNKLGYLVTYDEIVSKYSKGFTITPGNFVDWLVDNGFEEDKMKAFNKYFRDGELRHRKCDRMDVKTAIEFIKSINGIPVLAHPIRMKMAEELLIEKIKYWKSVGLKGIEAIYSLNSDDDNKKYLGWAKDLDLIYTIGTDYHGEHFKPGINIGTGIYGNMNKWNNENLDFYNI